MDITLDTYLAIQGTMWRKPIWTRKEKATYDEPTGVYGKCIHLSWSRLPLKAHMTS